MLLLELLLRPALLEPTASSRRGVSQALALTTHMQAHNAAHPTTQDDGGGGGGGDWGWERTVRNLLPNLAFLGLYFAITSYGGDGWGNGPFGEWRCWVGVV